MKKIELWKNKDELSDKVAIIDDEDYERVVEAIRYKNGMPGKWYAHEVAKGYCYATSGSRRTFIHRVVMNAPSGMDVDHINGDRLDNRKQNLRVCTRAQNSSNKKLRRDSKSGFKGVYEHKRGSKYVSKKTGEVKYYACRAKRFQAYIGDPGTSGRHIQLGHYTTAEEAARAYDRKAIELQGEFAYTNFPISDYLEN